MKKINLGVALALLLGLSAHAQTAISSSGGQASGSGGTVDYTAGQTTYNSYVGSSGSISQGVQQWFNVSIITIDHPNMEAVSLSAVAYPNPVSYQLQLDVAISDGQNLSYSLYDLNGKCLQQASITDAKSIIDMSAYTEGVYLMKVVNITNAQQSQFKTFTITKN